jgi:hypothetical protein
MILARTGAAERALPRNSICLRRLIVKPLMESMAEFNVQFAAPVYGYKQCSEMLPNKHMYITMGLEVILKSEKTERRAT